jgi:hypothetical protein
VEAGATGATADAHTYPTTPDGKDRSDITGARSTGGCRERLRPEQQFRYEIEQIWLWRYAETDRREQPLRPYRFGPDWLDSVDGSRIAQRRDVLDIVTDVLTGRAVEVAGRQVRPHKTHATGGAPQLVRGDGATAWRCNIKNNTPAAPRMTWWKLPDGTVELGRVSLHDDTRLR